MTPVAHQAAFSPEDLRRVEEIERLASGGGVDRLIAMLDDPSWAVRRAVVAALAAAGPRAVGFLCEALQTRRASEGRIAATVDALSVVSGDADPALAAMAADAEVPVLADIAQILGRRRTSSALPTVVALSRHRDDNVAVAAIEALGRIGGRAAVDSLVDAVKSGNFFRVFPAIEVLGRSGDPRAVAPLTALLEQPQYATEVVRALGRTGDVAAVAPLMRLLAKSSGAIVRLAALALGDLHQRYRERSGNGDAVAAEIAAGARESGIVRHLLMALSEGDPAEQAALCFLLGVVRDPSAAPMLTALLDAPSPVADAAATALRGLGPEVEEQILQGIRAGDSVHKRALLPFVSSAGGTKDVVASLRDADADVRVLACEALARTGAVAAVGALFPLLADTDTRVSYAALAAIQALGSRETDRLAIEAAASPDVQVRRAALRILAYFGSSSALEAFLTALRDPDERVREAAVQGLPFMDDPRAFEALVAAAKDEVERTRAAAMRSLGHCVADLRASAYLLKGLADPAPWVRYFACQALGKLAFEPAAEAIMRLLRDPAGQVRVAAVEALSCLPGDVAAQALNAAAVDADSDIQRAALVGLGVAQRSDSLPLILNAARTPDPATRLVAISALAGFRSLSVLSAFRVAASDADESVRTASIGFLAAMPGGPATRTLITMLATTTATEEILTALSLHVEGRISGLVVGLEEANDETAPALTSALARMRRPDAAAALVKTMGMQNVAARKAAAGALAILATKDALSVLRKAAGEDPGPRGAPDLLPAPGALGGHASAAHVPTGVFHPEHPRRRSRGPALRPDARADLRREGRGPRRRGGLRVAPRLLLFSPLRRGGPARARQPRRGAGRRRDLLLSRARAARDGRRRVRHADPRGRPPPAHLVRGLRHGRGAPHRRDAARDSWHPARRRSGRQRHQRRGPGARPLGSLRPAVTAAADVPPFAARWIRVGEREVTVDARLTEAIAWRRVNLVDDEAVAGQGSFDVILCRNVLIYFSDETVRRVIDGLASHLLPNGVLFVGISESLLRFGTPLSCEERNGIFLYKKAP